MCAGCAMLHAGLLLNSLFNREGGGYLFLWNVVWRSTNYMVLNTSEYNSSCGNLPQSCFTVSASLRESCRLANQREA
jgi:hypothetical protein